MTWYDPFVEPGSGGECRTDPGRAHRMVWCGSRWEAADVHGRTGRILCVVLVCVKCGHEHLIERMPRRAA